jgi:hypothetical protein
VGKHLGAIMPPIGERAIAFTGMISLERGASSSLLTVGSESLAPSMAT